MGLFALLFVGLCVLAFVVFRAATKSKGGSTGETMDGRGEVEVSTEARGTKKRTKGRRFAVAAGGRGESISFPEGENEPVASGPVKDLWEDSDYCWVVVCKNHFFHRRRNLFNVHRIPLGRTDGVEIRPAIRGRFTVRCDECGKKYFYQVSEVLRFEMSVAKTFVAHPLFRERD